MFYLSLQCENLLPVTVIQEIHSIPLGSIVIVVIESKQCFIIKFLLNPLVYPQHCV